MKKILIATSALAFASSAFAADVSGYAISAYKQKASKNSLSKNSLYTEAEVYFSGSKTISNGLTFGATYTIGLDGDSNSVTNNKVAVDGQLPTLAIVTPVGSIAVAEDGIETTAAKIERGDYANVNTFVSGSFGKVQMGHHSSASKALGTASVAAGESISASWTADATRTTDDNAFTYTSPSVGGVQAAFTKILGDDISKSMAVKYTGNFAGFGVAIAHGQSTVAKTYTDEIIPFKTAATGFKLSKDAFSVSYSVANTDASGVINKVSATAVNPSDGSAAVLEDDLFPKSKTTRLGVGYSANGLTLGASVRKTDFGVDDVRTNDVYVGYDVATGLTVFGEVVKEGDKKTTYIGTNISF